MVNLEDINNYEDKVNTIKRMESKTKPLIKELYLVTFLYVLSIVILCFNYI